MHSKKSIFPGDQFLSGGGEMGELMRAKDWNKTLVGTPDTWPQSLRTTLSIILNSKFPMFLFWGPDLICFYNDAYRPSLGNDGKHPNILGSRAEDYWQEIWPVIKPLIDQVLAGGEATWSEDQLIPIYRNGKLEDVYWTFSYSPVNDESGKPAGVFITCNETTDKVITRKKLEESKDQLQFAIEAAESGTWDYNPATNKFTCNDRLKEWFGLPPEINIELHHAINAIAEKDRQRIVEAIQKSLDYSSGGSYEAEYSIIHPVTKNERIVKGKGKAWFTNEKIAYRFNGILEDVTEQVFARRKIEESEEKFRTMAESTDILIGVNDESVNAVYFNKVWTTLTGRRMEDLLNLGWADLLHPDDREPFLNKFFTAYEKKESYDGEFRILNKEGTYSWLYAKVQVRLHPDGSYAGHISSSIDITERKRVEDAIKQKEQYIRSLVESAPFPIGVYVGREMRIELVNDSILRAWGRNKEVTGKLYADVLPELKDQGLFEQLDDVFTTGIAFHAKNQPLDLVVDGKLQTFYYNYSFIPLYDAAGKIYGILNTGANVTDLNIATQKIKESDKKFRNTVRQAPIGITILRGNQFMVEMANDAYLRLVDRKEEEFVGRPLFESLPEVKQTVYPLLKDVLDTGIPFHGAGYPIPVNRYGKEEISYFDFLYHPLKEDDGNISGIIVTVTDVSTPVKAKHLLQESENRFRNMVMHSPVAKTILKGEDHIIEMANPVMLEKIWRKKENEVIGKKMLDVFPELKEQNQSNLLKEVFTTGKLHKEIESVIYIQGDDGVKKFYLDLQYSPLHEPGEIISGIMITANDVTERVEARQKIEENEERLRMAMQLTNLGTWEFNPLSGELNWSQECKDIYALPEGIAIDFKAFSDHIHPDDREYVEAAIQNSMDASGDGKYDISYRILRFNDNSTRWIRAKGKVYFNAEEKPERFIGTVVDITEQKLSQQILEESEQRSRLAIEAAEMGTFDWDLVTNEFISSQRLNDIFGFTGQPHITHKNLIDAFHPEDKPRRDEAVENAAAKGSLSYEARIIWPDKSVHWVSVYGKIIYNEQRQPLKMYGTVVDTTEEKTNLKALEDSTARLNIAIAASELGMWELDLLTRKPYYSDRYLEILGYKERIDLTHEQILTHLHPDDLPIREEAFKKALDTGTLHYESRIIWNDQSIHWIEGKGRVFYNENNQPARLMGTLRDITEEKFYQKELQDREQKFRLLADSMPEFVWTGDEEGSLNYFNQSVYNYSGLTPEQIDRDGWLQIVHPEDQDENIRKWMHSITTGTDFVFEHRFRKYDGEYRWQLSRAIPQKDNDGNIRMWVGTSTDIQDHKMFTNELEQQVSERTKELEQKNKDLEKMNNELQSFAFVSSHDLQEPLRKIQTFGMLILENDQQNLTDTGKDYFHRMQDAAKRMQTLIEDLLSYSRTNTGDRKFENVSINKILHQVKADLKEEIGKKKATIESGDLSEANVIAFQFRQLLTNLISNSLKFSSTERSPHIKIKSGIVQGDESGISDLSPHELYYQLTIEDNGIGFEPEHKDRIFQIFQRLHGKHKYPGTGIGLAIVKKIAENHNGLVTATGHPDNGATFTIYLPIASKQV